MSTCFMSSIANTLEIFKKYNNFVHIKMQT